MNEMVVSYQPNGGPAPPPAPPARMFDRDLLDQVWTLAESAANSGMFPGITKPEQAFSLMMLCQSEGLHPMQAMRRYHIIEGRPTMRADAIQAEFQARGGTIKILRCDAEEARAIFSHPKLQPEGFEFAVTYAQFKESGMILGKYGLKDNWKHHPADMLWARLVAKGVRKVYPGIVAGIYTPEEAEDMTAPAYSSETVARLAAPPADDSRPAPAPADAEVIGFAGGGFDGRPYVRLAEEAVECHNAAVAGAWEGVPDARPPSVNVRDLHRHVLFAAINLGHAEGPPPTGLTKAIGEISRVYKAHRAWVRGEIMAYLGKEAEAAEAALRDALQGAGGEGLDPDDYGGEVTAEVA